MGVNKVKSGTIAFRLNTFWAKSELDSSLKWVEMSIKVEKCKLRVEMAEEVRETTKNDP